MTFLFLPLLTNYIMNAKFGLPFSVMYKNGFKMSVPANGITDFHVKKSWEFNVYFGQQICPCEVLIGVIVLQYRYWH